MIKLRKSTITLEDPKLKTRQLDRAESSNLLVVRSLIFSDLKLILSAILVGVFLIVGISQAYADEAEDWCNTQSGVKNEESMKQCKEGYQWMKDDSTNDEQFKKRLSTTEFEGYSETTQISESVSDSNSIRDLLIENRNLKHQIINLENRNSSLESQINDLKLQLENAQQIIMAQLQVIMNTLANLKIQ